MHFLAGRNLRKTLRDCGGPGLSVANVLWVLEKVAAALDHAHFHGVVHGDIKPDNIMLDVGSEQLHVIDFGLASASRGQKLPAMAAGRVLGSTGYLSPERQRGRELKAACDHWSLAVMTWELLTGGLPAAASPDGLGVADVERVGELSAEHVVFQAVFDRAFAAESDDRYQSSLEFVESMRGATGIRPEIEGLPADGG
ncbi:MAG: protein kinase domain-containing protein, partial [Planctomyces sp.]